MEHLDHPCPPFQWCQNGGILLLCAFIIALEGKGHNCSFYSVQDCPSAPGPSPQVVNFATMYQWVFIFIAKNSTCGHDFITGTSHCWHIGSVISSKEAIKVSTVSFWKNSGNFQLSECDIYNSHVHPNSSQKVVLNTVASSLILPLLGSRAKQANLMNERSLIFNDQGIT